MPWNCTSQAARGESLEPPEVFDLLPPFELSDPESPDFDSEDLESDFDSEDLESDFDSPELSADSDFPVSLLLPLSRKSVTYHPSPLRWNAAALISFLSLSFPQDGHRRFGLSLNFWMNS